SSPSRIRTYGGLYMIRKVISGGQTGADQGGLRAAKKAGIDTGGWIPKGFLTEDGKRPELGEEFGLRETWSTRYAERTNMNVEDAHGTLIFTNNKMSPGTQCALRAIERCCSPYLVVSEGSHPDEVVEWIKRNCIEILNVAGNRESSWPGIGDRVERF